MNRRGEKTCRQMKWYGQVRGGTATVLRSVSIALILAITACSVEELQPAVVVSDIPQMSLQAGTVVSVGAVNQRERTYPVVTNGESGSHAVPAGVIRLFDTRAAAEEFVRESEGILGRTAQASVNALRVRTGPTTSSDVLYRLRLHEEVTLVSVATPETTVGGRRGVWLEVVADGAYRGFVFSPLLQGLPPSITLPTGDGTGTIAQISTDAIEDIHSVVGGNIWWGTAAAEAVERGAAVLEVFRLSGGILTILTGETSLQLPLEEAAVSYPRVVFPDKGVELTIRDAETVELTIETDDVSIRGDFIPVEGYSWRELQGIYERRKDFASALEGYAGLYRSNTYGELTIHDGGTLSWQGGNILRPLGIGSGLEHRRILYAPIPAPGTATGYDGGINLPSPEGPAFLVDLQDDGIRLVWLPEFDRKSPFVTSPPVPPLVMYFSRESGGVSPSASHPVEAVMNE